jgi:hypothetical protein
MFSDAPDGAARERRRTLPHSLEEGPLAGRPALTAAIGPGEAYDEPYWMLMIRSPGSVVTTST